MRGKIRIRKVKAHPERWGKPGEWNIGEKGNWMADRVADDCDGIKHSISAKQIIKELGKRALVQTVDNEGVPFFGDLRKRNSKYKVKKYYKCRDIYRTNKRLPPIWEGTNGAKAHFLIGLNKYIEARAASIRVSMGKTWALSRHNSDECKACGSWNKGLDHALLRCKHVDVAAARREWRKNTYMHTKKVKNGDLRGIMGEIVSKAFNNKGGEYACVGTFRPQFVDQLHLGHLQVTPGEEKTIWNVLKTLGQGSRKVLRVFSEAIAGELGPAELRQPNIQDYFKFIRVPKQHRDGEQEQTAGSKRKQQEPDEDAKGAKNREQPNRKACRKGGIRNPVLEGNILYWEFRAG